MTDRKQLKENARLAMRQARPSPVWVTLVTELILAVMLVLSLSLSGELEAYGTILETYVTTGQIVTAEPASTSLFGSILTLALELMTTVVSVGYTLYALRVSRRQSASFGDVFDAFGIFFRAVWLGILMNVVVSLSAFAYTLPATALVTLTGSYVPAIVCLPLLALPVIVVYGYRLAVFIMLDNPQLGCLQCLAASRAAMRGHKWELFRLDLSFLGWYILCIVPFVILWVEPYVTVTTAVYYDALMPDFWERVKDGAFRPQTPPPADYHIPGERRDDEEK